MEHTLVNAGARPRGSKSSSCVTGCTRSVIQISTVSFIGL